MQIYNSESSGRLQLNRIQFWWLFQNCLFSAALGTRFRDGFASIDGMAQTPYKCHILPFLCYYFIRTILEATKDKHLGFMPLM